MKSNTYQKHRILIDLSLLGALVFITGLIPYLYVSSEQYFYYWDHANHPNQTSELVTAIRNSPGEAVWMILASLKSDYNKIPCLPVVPFFLVFGESRLVYIVGSALVYILPFSLIMGKVATKIISSHPQSVFWSTAFLTLLIPTTWTATLRGYPDLGGACIIALAVLAYLSDIRLIKRWQVPAIAFLLALAILFRRHFAYSVRAFVVAMMLQGLVLFMGEFHDAPSRAIQNLRHYSIRIGLLIIGILLLSPVLIYKVMHNDYGLLYSSYEDPVILLLQYYLDEFGGLVWFLVVLGFFLGYRSNLFNRTNTYFIGFYGCLSLIDWALFSKQTGTQYSTHFLFLVILGLTSLLWSIWTKKDGNRIYIFFYPVVIAILAANIAFRLSPFGQMDASWRPLFASSKLPLVRQDYEEFSRLVSYLRQVSSEHQAIYVVGSSDILNQDVLRQAERQLYGQSNSILNVIGSPDVDSRDTYPLEGWLQTQFFVVASPFQYHLRPEDQDVVKVGLDAFRENWGFIQDFQRLPEQFILGNDVLVNIYHRSRPTSLGTVLQTLREMQSRIQPRPGSQGDWITLKNIVAESIAQNQAAQDQEDLSNVRPSSALTTSFLYFGQIPATVKVTGGVNLLEDTSKCDALSLRLSTLSSSGQETQGTSALLDSSHGSSNFSLSLPSQQATYLRLERVNQHK